MVESGTEGLRDLLGPQGFERFEETLESKLGEWIRERLRRAEEGRAELKG